MCRPLSPLRSHSWRPAPGRQLSDLSGLSGWRVYPPILPDLYISYNPVTPYLLRPWQSGQVSCVLIRGTVHPSVDVGGRTENAHEMV